MRAWGMVGLVCFSALGCGGEGAGDVAWDVRFVGLEPRPSTMLEVSQRESCDPGAEETARWEEPLDRRHVLEEVGADPFALRVTATDPVCGAYAVGCALWPRGVDTGVEVTVELRAIRPCPDGAEPDAATGDGGMPAADAATDAAVEDAGRGSMDDAGRADGGSLDASTDGALTDAGFTDAGPADASTCDPVACPGRRCVGGACGHWASCDALVGGAGTPSGAYEIDPDGAGSVEPFPVWCERVGDAGWTLLLKVDGTSSRFRYVGSLWTNGTLHAESSLDLGETEAKLRGFETVSFNAMRVGLRRDGETRWLELPVAAASLRDLFSGGHAATNAGRSTWEGLLDGTLLQDDCNREGINVTRDSGLGEARIGIIANQEDHCGSPDSAIGIGLRSPASGCDQSYDVTAGDVRACGAYRNEPAFGYVLVR